MMWLDVLIEKNMTKCLLYKKCSGWTYPIFLHVNLRFLPSTQECICLFIWRKNDDPSRLCFTDEDVTKFIPLNLCHWLWDQMYSVKIFVKVVSCYFSVNARHIWIIEKVQICQLPFFQSFSFTLIIISITSQQNISQLITPQMIMSQSNTSQLNSLWPVKWKQFNLHLWMKIHKFRQLDICKINSWTNYYLKI